MEYYQKPFKQIFKKLKSSMEGLSEEEAKKRLLKYGLNIFKRKRARSIFGIFFSQFANFLIFLLVLAFFISLFTQPLSHTLVLLLIVLLNVLMGFVLEFKAEKALEGLKKIFTPKATVLREGKEKIISANNLVLGDIVLLNQGERVAADLRLFETSNLEIDESALTGESIPSRKVTEPLSPKTPLADQENIAFCGTLVASGQGKGIVVAASSETEMGKIAASIQEVPEKTPLQERLNYLGKILAGISIFLVGVIFLLGTFRDEAFLDLLNYSLALLVSAVPEGLPTVVTLALAIGVIKMAKNRAIIRKLPAVETLASINVICADKTGTLTKNEMTVKKIWLAPSKVEGLPKKGEIGVEGEGYLPEPKIDLKAKAGLPAVALAKAGFLCNKAILNFAQEKEKWQIIGDPTEGALLVLGQKAGVDKEIKDHQKVHEILFEEKRRLMSVVFREKGRTFVYTKGAPEAVLSISKIGKEEKQKSEREIEKLAKQGYRVLGLGFKELKGEIKLTDEEIEKDLNFLGLVALIDPPAPGAKEAIKLCQIAQIKPVIISGDHKLTTMNVAKQLGLKVEEENVLTGEELEEMSDEELAKIIDKIQVFARTSPLQKVKILNAFKKKGHQVAMTGDGINDAPALKLADIGIAMGEKGQDVAKEASDLILADDQFATIEKAIEYARSLYDNFARIILFLLSTNFNEILLVSVIFLFFADLPLPLTALQILWINLVTESIPALALVYEKPNPLIMKEPPKNPKKSIILPLFRNAGLIAVLSLFLNLLLFLNYLPLGEVQARSIVFAFIVLFQISVIFSIRSKKPFWSFGKAQDKSGGFFENRHLILAAFSSLLLLCLSLYTPLNRAMGSAPLNLTQWFSILGLCFISFMVLEMVKVLRSRK